MSLLRPLLLDVIPTIQQTAALALGRLANYNDDLAEAVVKGDILPQLMCSLPEQNVRHHCFLKQYCFLTVAQGKGNLSVSAICCYSNVAIDVLKSETACMFEPLRDQCVLCA